MTSGWYVRPVSFWSMSIMELKVSALHQGLMRDGSVGEVDQPVSTFRQGASAMSNDRIANRVQGALDRAKERETQAVGKALAPPVAVIVDLVVEEKRLMERQADLVAELEKVELSLGAVKHLKQVYGSKTGVEW